MKQSRLLILACMCLALIAGLAAWWNANRFSPQSEPVRYWIKKASPMYAAMPVVPASDKAELHSAAMNAEIVGLDGIPDSPQPELIQQLSQRVADLLYYRFGQPDAQVYIDWRRSQGYYFLPREDFEKRYYMSLDDIMTYQFGAPQTGIHTPKDLFLPLWKHEKIRDKGLAVANSIASSSAGFQIAIGRSNHNRAFIGSLRGEIGRELWYGGISSSCKLWMVNAVTRDSVIAKYGEALAAEAGVVAEFEQGDRRPIIFGFFYDPDGKEWIFDGVAVNNFAPPGGKTPCVEF